MLVEVKELVRGNHEAFSNDTLEEANSLYNIFSEVTPLLYSSTGLSFWGGIDPETGLVIDHTHPLYGQCVTGKALAIPSSRGSCTGSQVLLECILNQTGPSMILARDVDTILATGAIIAEEMFANNSKNDKNNIMQIPNVLSLGEQTFEKLGKKNHKFIQILTPRGYDNSDEINEYKFLRTTNQPVILSSGNSIQEVQTQSNKSNIFPKDTSFSNKTNLLLTQEEKKILSLSFDTDNFDKHQMYTPADQIALRILLRIAYITNSPRLVSVTRAHIDACVYTGPGGLKFIEQILELGGRVTVPTTLNSCSVDRSWIISSPPCDCAKKALPDPHSCTPKKNKTNRILFDRNCERLNAATKLADRYVALGANSESFTCAPYLLDPLPKPGEQIAWGESNAVIFANSILGAKTNKYADYLDVCAAIVGKVPQYGMHADDEKDERIFSVILDASELIKNHIELPLKKRKENGSSGFLGDIDAFFPTFGYCVGNLSNGKIPMVIGLENLVEDISMDDWKAFSAAFGTTGSSPIFYIAGVGVTPNLNKIEEEKLMRCEKIIVSQEDLQNSYCALNSSSTDTTEKKTGEAGKIDLVAIGNPHLSLSECQYLALLCTQLSTKKHPNVSIIATLGREIYNKADELGYITTLRNFGFEFINDTCWCMLTDAPIIPSDPTSQIMTNSGKYAHYGPGLVDRKVRFGSMINCVQTATTGFAPSSSPSWLSNGLHRASSTRYLSMKISSEMSMNFIAKGMLSFLTRRKI